MSNTAAPSTAQVADQLRNLQAQLRQLLEQTHNVLASAPGVTHERSQSFWQLFGALQAFQADTESWNENHP